MSYRIWKEKYGAAPSVVGAGYLINGHPFTVIGVASPGFYGAKLAGQGMPDFWLPLTTELVIDGDTAGGPRQCGEDGVAWRLLAGRIAPRPRYAWLSVRRAAWDPVMLTLATLLLALAALLASLIPARRAAGVQPMVALRNE
jgi:hypothetical protein